MGDNSNVKHFLSLIKSPLFVPYVYTVNLDIKYDAIWMSILSIGGEWVNNTVKISTTIKI